MIIETILHQEDQSKTFCSLWNYRIISKSYNFFFRPFASCWFIFTASEEDRFWISHENIIDIEYRFKQ